MGLRDSKNKIVRNDTEQYKELLDRRGVKRITHYGTPIVRHPSVEQRASIPTTGHIWAYGDRFYNLAHKYYGDANFWWVIAWWNGYPTEGHVKTGDYLDIPLDLPAALEVLGV